LKVLMVSTSYPESAQDWRGRFIADLAGGLGHVKEISLSLWAPPGELPHGVASVTTEQDKTWLHHLAQLGGIAHLIRNERLRAAGTILELLVRLRQVYRRNAADVVHVNWLQNALPLFGMRTPALVTVLGSDFGLLRLPGMKQLLRSVFKRRRIILAPNANWMVPMLNRAFGDIAEIHSVPFGIDKRWFALQRRRPKGNDEQHWVVITRLTKNKIGDLLDWGEGLFGTHRVLHLFGPMQEEITLPEWVQYHGPTHPAELLDTWFPMASGLITLSRHDEGRPQVMLEAMAAGLPLIASDLPAHRDFVEHRQTGWLASSQADFKSALDYLEQPEHNLRIGQAARTWAKQEIGTWDDCAARYCTLYSKLLEPQP
jgi:glycosyltransferase involved in cell wall biosynthesis